jgi:hypothetical protein
MQKARDLGRGPEGVSVDLLKKQCIADGFPESHVRFVSLYLLFHDNFRFRDAIDDLFSNGHLYHTTDENTCKAAF